MIWAIPVVPHTSQPSSICKSRIVPYLWPGGCLNLKHSSRNEMLLCGEGSHIGRRLANRSAYLIQKLSSPADAAV